MHASKMDSECYFRVGRFRVSAWLSGIGPFSSSLPTVKSKLQQIRALPPPTVVPQPSLSSVPYFVKCKMCVMWNFIFHFLLFYNSRFSHQFSLHAPHVIVPAVCDLWLKHNTTMSHSHPVSPCRVLHSRLKIYLFLYTQYNITNQTFFLPPFTYT